MSDIDNKVRNSTKWTLLTECLSKIITPLTGMLLARMLSPTAFGIVAAILVVTSFAEMFADAGFQKYFVQHEFYSKQEKNIGFITALITSCLIAVFVWIVICLLADWIASRLGIIGAEWGIRLASIGIIINSFNGMQSAIFKRNFQFKLLFKLRMAVLFVPLLVTIPLAYMGTGYWALIIGTLTQQVITCIIQFHYMDIELAWLFDWQILHKMLSFSLWTLLESVTIWLSTWGGMFMISIFLNSYYLGIYRGVMTLVGAAFSILTGAIIPVIFSALSRLQNDMEAFRILIFDIQYKAALFILPLGMMMYIFQDVFIDIMLGSQWHDGDFFFGLWSLTMCLSILINGFASEALRAKGMPRMSALSQFLHFPVLFIVLWYTAKFNFDVMVIGTCLSSLWMCFVKIIMLRQILGFSLRKMAGNILNAALPAGAAGGLAWYIRQWLGADEILAVISAMGVFVIAYLLFIMASKNNRRLVVAGVTYLRDKIRR